MTPSIPASDRSSARNRLLSRMRRVVASDVWVLVEGEAGTGKSVAAEMIHSGSSRVRGNLVVIDCAGLTPTRMDADPLLDESGLKRAHGGTLVLDRIDELDAHLQPRLAAVLDSLSHRRRDVRVLALSRSHLSSLVRQGAYSEALYWRLAVYHLELPPLRMYLDEIAEVALSLLGMLFSKYPAQEPCVESAALDLLRQHSWPGNLRELANALEAAVIDSEGAPIGRDALAVALGKAKRTSGIVPGAWSCHNDS